MEDLDPLVVSQMMRFQRRSWTTLYLEENPFRRFGRATAGSCAGSAQFPQNLVREFEKTASNGFRSDALVDASSRTKKSLLEPAVCHTSARRHTLLTTAVGFTSGNDVPQDTGEFSVRTGLS